MGDRRLVLLVENLDEVFRRIGADGQSRFRAFAEDWQQLLILASAPQLFAGVQRHASPFYGFFAVTHLDELSLTSATELLKRIANLHGDEALARYLDTDTAAHRLTAVEALAGGHPRIWLLLAGCISIAGIDELVSLFLEALDDLTPYYQDRLHELSDQQQELVVLLGEAGGALSNRELTERSGLGQAQVAKLLSQLADRGYVRHATLPEHLAGGDRRMTFWELREPLMRLCLDIKQARGEPLRLVVEFLRAWYGTKLLDELDRLPASATLATTLRDRGLSHARIWTRPRSRISCAACRRRRSPALNAVFRFALKTPALRRVRSLGLLLVGRDEDAVAAVMSDTGVDPATAHYHYMHASLLRLLGRLDEAEQAARRGIGLDEHDPFCRMAVAEIALARGDAAGAMSLLREALAVWEPGARTPPGDRHLYVRPCGVFGATRVGARSSRRSSRHLTRLMRSGISGRGLVNSVRTFTNTSVRQQEVDTWVEAWESASTSPELEIPLDILRAAREWKRDGDRAHLLALPPEQRDILVGLLRLADPVPQPLPAVNMPGSKDFTPGSAA